MSRRCGNLASEVELLMSRCAREGACLVVPTKGYGSVRFDRGQRMAAHRASFIAAHGPIPEGLVVRHRCDRVGCIEPSHLELGTPAENNADMIKRRRNRTGVTHHASRHTADAVRSAVSDYLLGSEPQWKVAKRHGVSQPTLGRWVRAASRLDAGLSGVSVGKGSRYIVGVLGCGTRAGAVTHRRNGEQPCEPCAEADRQYMRDYMASRKAVA